jgi:glucan phosphoethanolaminetransferase (alkaline phosphatase superfamily)
MGNSEDTKKAKQFERVYTALLVLLVAILLLISILYTPRLWLVKVVIALILISIGAFFGHRYLRER